MIMNYCWKDKYDKVLEETYVAVPICLPHITHDFTWVRNQVFEVRGPWLTM